jgi:ribonuclease VapC
MKLETGGNCVIDASALIALFFNEPGATDVLKHVRNSMGLVSIVNYCEVLTELYETGFPVKEFDTVFDGMPLTLVDINKEISRYAAALRPSTRHAGLSLGDRYCLACAYYYRGTALTADRAWNTVKVSIPIVCIR